MWTIHIRTDSPNQNFGSDNVLMTGYYQTLQKQTLVKFFFTVVPGETGGEGCTPGYWKQSQHFDSWTPPYMPTTLFSAVFENAFPGMTLVQVMETGGGGLNALGRHTVAALLNAASPNVEYGFTTAEVIAMFNAAYPGSEDGYEGLKDIFEVNNEYGCPID